MTTAKEPHGAELSLDEQKLLECFDFQRKKHKNSYEDRYSLPFGIMEYKPDILKSLKRLLELGLVTETELDGEFYFSITPRGQEFCTCHKLNETKVT